MGSTITSALHELESLLARADEQIALAEEQVRVGELVRALAERREKAMQLGLTELGAQLEAALESLAPQPPPETAVVQLQISPKEIPELVIPSPSAPVAVDPDEPEVLVRYTVQDYTHSLEAVSKTLDQLQQHPISEPQDLLTAYKALVARVRATVLIAEEANVNGWEADTLLKELRNSELTPDEYIFGFSADDGMVRPWPDWWQNIADMYDRFPTASRILTWLKENSDVSNETAEPLLLGAAAIEALLYRQLQPLQKWDPQQGALHRGLESVAQERGVYVPVWASRVPDRDLELLAGSAAADLERAETTLERGRDRQEAISQIQRIAGGKTSTTDFEYELFAAISAAVTAGVPPSSIELREVLLPYAFLLEVSTDKGVLRVYKELQKELARLDTTGSVEEETEIQSDPMFEDKLQRVRPHTEGKIGIMIGGKCQEERRREIQEVLGLAELHWPDAEHDTKVKDLKALAKRSDVVFWAIRWSRKSYRDLVQACRTQGKRTVTLRAGLNIHRIVNDFCEQVG